MTSAQVEEQIVGLLQEPAAELHTEEIAERVGLERHTVSKYLQILQAKGMVQVRRVGNAKLWCDPLTHMQIRDLSLEDLPQILQLEKEVEQTRAAHEAQPSLDFLENTARAIIQREESGIGLGAETRGQLVGFILGEARLWEFGRGERIGWIEAISVAPEFQGREIGRCLGEALLTRFVRVGVRRVRTLVDWYDGELLAYFKSLGFDILEMIPLERKLNPTQQESKEQR